ncbi:MAG: hypothetical protein KKB37_08460, partial [Alphaproteobacteria bacterium]|nr:hypothetical protein [Alphaproteobacteria bacterium]
MRARQAREIPISRYLEIEGVKPASVRRGGRELWYSSPIRSGDKTPSFKVDTVLKRLVRPRPRPRRHDHRSRVRAEVRHR